MLYFSPVWNNKAIPIPENPFIINKLNIAFVYKFYTVIIAIIQIFEISNLTF